MRTGQDVPVLVMLQKQRSLACAAGEDAVCSTCSSPVRRLSLLYACALSWLKMTKTRVSRLAPVAQTPRWCSCRAADQDLHLILVRALSPERVTEHVCPHWEQKKKARARRSLRLSPGQAHRPRRRRPHRVGARVQLASRVHSRCCCCFFVRRLVDLLLTRLLLPCLSLLLRR